MKKTYAEKKTGLVCREGTLDEYVVKEQSSYSPIFELVKGKTVMDIGANIGAFSYTALKNGADKVIAFEPDEDNAKLYELNVPKDAKLFRGAVASKTGTAILYVNESGKNKGLHSLQQINGRTQIEVKTYSFRKALEKFRPQILKIDIEGGEYDLELHDLPEYIEAICMEIHLSHGDNREMGKKLIKSLKKQFPNVLKDSNITDKNWTTLLIAKR